MSTIVIEEQNGKVTVEDLTVATTVVAGPILKAGAFVDLTDTPLTLGTPGQVPVVTIDGQGMEFVDSNIGGTYWGAILGDITTQVDLQNSFDGKVDDSQVLTNVPAGAVFTDTVYDDSDVLKDADTQSPVTSSNKVATMAEITTAGTGDMTKAVYDQNNSGTVDDSEKVNGLTVQTAVPSGAVFTDTIYDDSAVLKDSDTVSPVTPTNKILTQANAADAMQKSVYDTNLSGIVDNAEKVNNLTVETAVPAGALFTDTVYDDSDVLKDADTASAVTLTNKLVTENELATSGFGDMSKAAYDTNDSGVVDDAEKVNGLTVETSVPTGALFTDTVYNDTPVQNNTTAISNHVADVSNPHGVTKTQLGLENVDNTADLDKPISTATVTALAGKENSLGNPAGANYVLISDNLGTRTWLAPDQLGVTSVNGETGVVTLDSSDIAESVNLYFTDARADARIQAAIKDTVSSTTTLYSSAKIDAIVSGSLTYKGGWDANTNTPAIADNTGSNGDFYKVTTAGTQDLGSGSIVFSEGDDVIHNGTQFERFGSTNAVDSVNGKVGAVVLGSDDINEGALNLYYTDARVDARLTGIIADNSTVSDKTWSSTKINTSIAAAVGAIVHPVTSVAGRTGDVVLAKGDVGLSSVDNTADLDKPVSTATATAIGNVQADVNTNTTAIGNNTTAIGTNATNIATNTTDIGTNATNIGTNATNIATNTTNIGTNTTDIGNIGVVVTSHNGATNNPHAVTQAQVGLGNVDNTADLDKPVSTATATAMAAGDAERMQWKGYWTTGSYLKNDTVLDGAWSMVANKDTSDRPAPQPSGTPEFAIPTEDPQFSTLDNVSSVYSGHQYTLTKNGWIKEVRVWVPEVGTNISYRFVLSDITDPNNPISEVVETSGLVAGQWNTIKAGLAVIPAGRVIQLEVEASNSSSYTTFNGDWMYDDNGNSVIPAAGNWSTNFGRTILRINKTDGAAVDRSTDLAAIIPESVINFIQASDSTKSERYRVDSAPTDMGTYYEYSVSRINVGSGGEIDETENTSGAFAIPVAAATKYVEKSGYWSAQPSFATVVGFLQLDGVDQPNSNTNAYGIDIEFQEAVVSADWDLLSLSSSGGGGAATPTIDVIDSLNSTDATAALSANQGRILDLAKEDSIGNPATDGEVLVSTAAGVRSWSQRSASWGSLTGSISNQTDLQNALDAKEDGLGNPSNDGDVLVSTITGIRSWTTIQNTDVSAVWGNISGTLSNQSDLNTALDGKLDKTGGTVTGDIDIVSGSGAKLNIQSTVSGGQPQLHLTDSNSVPRAIFGVDTTTGDAGITRIDSSGTVEGTLRLDTLGNVKLLAGPTETTPIPTLDSHLVNKKYVDDYGDTLEPNLGVPAGNNYVLASDTAGNRTWFDASTLGVTSVNGATGVVTLDTSDISENGNLYYTIARADSRVQAAINDTTASATTLYSSTKTENVVSNAIASINHPVDSVNSKTGVVVLTTSDIAEGSHLYYTDTRADNRIQGTILDTVSSSTTLYSSSKVDSLISGSLNYKGSWNADTNSPSISDATGAQGDYYKVGTGGTRDLGSGVITFNVGDDVIHNGSVFEDFGSVSDVTSVNTQTGAVVLDSGDITENGNLYYTNARVDARLSGVIDDNSTALSKTWSASKISNGFASITHPVDSVNSKTGTVVLGSDDIAEGVTNLYYTDGRVDARLSGVIDDNTTVTSKTWSSTKIDNEISSSIGAITYPVTSVNGQTGAVTIAKADVGLGNVDNTSDLNKPVSNATATALSGKSDTNHLHTGVYEPANSNIQSHISDVTSNPHNVTFLELGDTPSSYNANEMLVVNTAGDAVASMVIPPLGVGKYIGSNIVHDTTGTSGAAITTGTGNIMSGNNTGMYLSSGHGNIGIGTQALESDITNTLTGSSNVAIGENAGADLTSGGHNVLLGGNAGRLLTTASNQLVISNSVAELITGDFAAQTLKLEGQTTFKSVRFEALHAVPSATSILVNLDDGQYQSVTLTANSTLAVTQPASPTTFYLHIHQDATGGRTLTFPTGKWVNGLAKTVTATANAHDMLMIHYYGSGNYVFELMQNLS